jgi:sporulation protein YlmC with PRC-barrel domain
MRLSELLARRVVSESGVRLGRVHDVRGELVDGRLRITGLVAGNMGILERYGVGTRGSGGPGRAKVHGHAVIPWEHVVHVGAMVVVRDEAAADSSR